MHDTDTLSAVFSALADPTRRAILQRLAKGDASVGELAEPFNMTVRGVSKHVAILERAGLIVRGKDAQRRPSRLELGPLQEVDTWLETYRGMWEGRFDRMGAALEQLKRGAGRRK
jgi:DNA-binding transcriptional ArsR family regulator